MLLGISLLLISRLQFKTFYITLDQPNDRHVRGLASDIADVIVGLLHLTSSPIRLQHR